jgi:hypothetical protein
MDGNLAAPFPWPLHVGPRNNVYPETPVWTDADLTQHIPLVGFGRLDHFYGFFLNVGLMPIRMCPSMIANPGSL